MFNRVQMKDATAIRVKHDGLPRIKKARQKGSGLKLAGGGLKLSGGGLKLSGGGLKLSGGGKSKYY